MSHEKGILVLAVIVGIAMGPAIVLGTPAPVIEGRPGLFVTAPSPTLAPGQTTELRLQVSNEGTLESGSPDQRAAVVTARDVKVEANAPEAPFEIESGTISLGSVGEQKPRDVNLAVTVPDDAEPGTYDVEVDVSYSYSAMYWGTQYKRDTVDLSRTISETIEVEIEDTARFELSDVSTDALVGSDGTMRATLENVGSERADDVRLTLESPGRAVTFGGANVEQSYVGSLDPGESTVIPYDIVVDPDASGRPYSIDGTVSYANADGLQRNDPDLATSVGPMGEQAFRLVNASGDLRAGTERPFSITVRNEGPQAVTDPVVRLGVDNPNVYLDSPAQALDTLEVNETATITYAIDVSASLEESRQGATVSIAYNDRDGDRRQSDPMTTAVSIGSERDHFDVSVQNGSVVAGETETVELVVTNAGERVISEIQLKAYLEDPLDSEDDETMISSLDPGETETVRFDVSVASSAPAKTYALSTDFYYQTHDGDAELSRRYAVPVEVEQPPGTDRPLGLIGSAIVVIGALVVMVLKRDRIRDLIR